MGAGTEDEECEVSDDEEEEEDGSCTSPALSRPPSVVSIASDRLEGNKLEGMGKLLNDDDDKAGDA